MRQFALVDAASGAARYLPATAPLDDGGGACRQAATLARGHGPLPAVLLTTSVTVISTITNANHSSQGEYQLSRDRIWRGARRPPAGRARDGRVPADGAATTRRARSGDGPGARLFLFRTGMSSPSASRVNIASIDVSSGPVAARSRSMVVRACRSRSLMLITVTSAGCLVPRRPCGWRSRRPRLARSIYIVSRYEWVAGTLSGPGTRRVGQAAGLLMELRSFPEADDVVDLLTMRIGTAQLLVAAGLRQATVIRPDRAAQHADRGTRPRTLLSGRADLPRSHRHLRPEGQGPAGPSGSRPRTGHTRTTPARETPPARTDRSAPVVSRPAAAAGTAVRSTSDGGMRARLGRPAAII